MINVEHVAAVPPKTRTRRNAIAVLAILAASVVLLFPYGSDAPHKQAIVPTVPLHPTAPKVASKPAAPKVATVHKSAPVAAPAPVAVHKSAPVATKHTYAPAPIASPAPVTSPAPVASPSPTGPGVVNGHQYPLCPDAVHYQYYGPNQNECPHTAANGY